MTATISLSCCLMPAPAQVSLCRRLQNPAKDLPCRNAQIRDPCLSDPARATILRRRAPQIREHLLVHHPLQNFKLHLPSILPPSRPSQSQIVCPIPSQHLASSSHGPNRISAACKRCILRDLHHFNGQQLRSHKTNLPCKINRPTLLLR